MPFSISPFRRFPVHCAVTYNAGPFQGQGTIWNLSCIGWRLSGDLPMRAGKTLSLTLTLPNEQRIEAPKAAENVVIQPQADARLEHLIMRLVHSQIPAAQTFEGEHHDR